MANFLTTTSQKPNYFHKLFYTLKLNNSSLLIVLFSWISFPALGVVPLLLFLQSRVSYFFIRKNSTFNIFKSDFLSILILILVLITITITSCFQEIEGDLQVYVSAYRDLGNDFGDILNGFKFESEPVSYIIPYIFKLFFNLNNDFSFLLIQSTTINLALIIIAIKFVPQYFPIVILLNITSGAYYMQLLLLRQFYSFIFFLLFAFEPLVIMKLLFGFLAIQTHNSSLAFIMSIIVYTFNNFINDVRSLNLNFLVQLKLFKWIQYFYRSIFLSNKFLYSIVILLIILTASNSIQTIFNISAYLEPLFPYAFKKIDYYMTVSDEMGLTKDLWKGISFDLLFLSVFLVFSNLNLRKINDSVFVSWIVIFLVSIISLVGFYSSIYLLGRNVFLLAGLSGFFYVIIFSSGKLTAKINLASLILILAIATKTLYYLYRLLLGTDYAQKNLYYYIQFIMSNISQ